MQNLQFKKTVRNFRDFFKISLKCYRSYRIFGENFDKNLEICIWGGSGAESPDANEFIEIWGENSMKTSNFW